jgi:hypothetical protein
MMMDMLTGAGNFEAHKLLLSIILVFKLEPFKSNKYLVSKVYPLEGTEYTGLFIWPWNILKVYNK